MRRWITTGLIAILFLAVWLAVRDNRTSPRLTPDPTELSTASRESSAPAGSAGSQTAAETARPQRTGDEWSRRWRALIAEPGTQARDEDMATFFEELAAIDPLRAISWADGEASPELRLTFLQAALRGWAGADPEEAIAWTASQSLMDEGQAVASVFHGVARDAGKALQLAETLSARDPAKAHDYGSYLVSALSDVGEFHDAAAFAAKGAVEVRTDWINVVYSRWAESEPKAALEHLGQLADREMRQTAFDATVSRWARKDAKALAEYSLTLSEERERSLALAQALRSWSAVNSAEAATWINRFDPSPEFDFGIAVIASRPESLQQPQIVLGWAESIADRRLRIRVIATIVNEWAVTDLDAARRYVENAPGIRTEDRPGVLSAFSPDFTPISLQP